MRTAPPPFPLSPYAQRFTRVEQQFLTLSPQQRALLNYASKQKMFQADIDDAKQGLAMVTQSKVMGGGGKSKRVILAEMENMS